uniref:Ion transport domain-containing protein n=1 Tax=Lotharella globosa TaxID=91324 RepID=A0A7S3Y9Z9_9EUKA|mmetsp:Transcript_15556/g.29321  ORF Transcript_15556/g.29321 Transcript_15556/m.29321 type:complete len:187 (+) Transcript_15556:188-748(+)
MINRTSLSCLQAFFLTVDAIKVDLLSVLPFYIAVSIAGNLDVVSTPVMQVLRLVRILKIERTISAFTLFDNVWSQSRTLLIGLGYVVIVLWLVFSCLMYLAERHHKSVAPDDDIVDHPYTNMLEAMWYTLLNITGEFPLGDYSVAGKMLGIFMVIFAIELYGAASGVFAEGFQSAVEKTGTRKDVW